MPARRSTQPAKGKIPARAKRRAKSGATGSPRAAWTRDRLVAETLAILCEEGTAAVSTVRLSAAIGIAQSGFYRYFASVDACIDAAIAPLASGFREDVARRRRVWFATRATDPQAGLEHYGENLRFVLAHRNLAELAVRRRYEASPVGRAMQALFEGMVSDLVDDLILATGASRVSERARLRLVSQIIVGASWTAVDSLLAETTTVPVAAALLAQLGMLVAAPPSPS